MRELLVNAEPWRQVFGAVLLSALAAALTYVRHLSKNRRYS
jgi:hypothetical protein